jgi:uncharacterized protein involved in exopolysaccharide biosynthesis
VKASLAEARKRLKEMQTSIPRREGTTKEGAGTTSATAKLEELDVDDPSLAATITQERERLDGLRAQETITTKQIATLNSERQQILAQISSIQAHVDHLPVREQQMASVMRDYDITKANYQSLLDKKLAAGMAADMEKRQKSERFTMLESARVPEVPFQPNRPLVAAIGAVASLLLAIAFAIGKAIHENVLLGEWELPKDAVILGRVPMIGAKRAAARSDLNPSKRLTVPRFAISLFIGTVVLGIGISLYFGWRLL